MAKTKFLNTVKTTIATACELSEVWVGTALEDKLSTQAEALVKGVENGEADRVADILLPQLLGTIDFARNRLEHQEA